MPNTTYARSQGRNRFSRRRYGRYVTKGYLKAVVGVPENKWLNVTQAPTAIPATGLNVQLNNIGTGTSQSSRIGNEVSNKTLHMRLDIARGAVDSLLRVIIYWYLDGSVATPESILEDVNYQSPLNKVNGKSFWVKFDKTYSIASGQTQLVVDEIWRKLKCKTEYSTPGDQPNLPVTTANALYVLFISNQATVANQPILSFTNRLTFLDV